MSAVLVSGFRLLRLFLSLSFRFLQRVLVLLLLNPSRVLPFFSSSIPLSLALSLSISLSLVRIGALSPHPSAVGFLQRGLHLQTCRSGAVLPALHIPP